ncbi:hypothetical protein MYP_692 [Sporocytophaga myxococcoides]|uniref:Uncharacterized protein n=1 Tax=Sporocytophaga myxococcoides TaxID=153721 RepID=A0A098L9A2_9BACT|nr:hypothetical protein [Sporocytophaga myxococcoides]GAL83465.1 hypothetical protein MYP_692 [Sporocytophaga myxococcoides]
MNLKESIPWSVGIKSIKRTGIKYIQQNGAYYERWKLVFEPGEKEDNGGYIFREINHNGGICGRHKTYRKAIFTAIGRDVRVFIGE